MPLLSIIVPVYNTARYLHQCLDSLTSQSFSDIEVLLIDDGSCDESGHICDECALIDKRIKVFHKENGGVSSARNIGIDNASGEWVMFVDSDDIIPPFALERLIECTNEGIDMSLGGYRKFDDKNDNIETVIVEEPGLYSAEQCIDSFIAPLKWSGDWQRYMVNRIFRLSIINAYHLRFRTDLHYKEDGLFLLQYLGKCTNDIIFISDIVYLYRQVPNSAMKGVYLSFNPRLFSIIDAHGELLKELHKLKAPKSLIKRELLHYYHNYFWIKDILNKTDANEKANNRILKSKTIKNGGVFNYLYHVIFLHYLDSIKRRIPFIS